MQVLDSYPWIDARFTGLKSEMGGRYVSASCPLKPHRTARLRFWVGEGGCLCFGCYGGCSKLEILRAVGATWKDCFPGGQVPDEPKQTITARYPYRSAAGVLLYETLRLEPGRHGRDKDFRQRRPKPGGGWAWNLEGVERVLYRLPELLASDPRRTCLVVAGEKDVESFREIGVLATTNVGGERAEWLDSYSAALAGRHVVVVEDRDSAGRRHTNEVVGSLVAHRAASVRRVTLPAKDATAFLNGLRVEGIRDREALRRALREALARERVWRAA